MDEDDQPTNEDTLAAPPGGGGARCAGNRIALRILRRDHPPPLCHAWRASCLRLSAGPACGIVKEPTLKEPTFKEPAFKESTFRCGNVNVPGQTPSVCDHDDQRWSVRFIRKQVEIRSEFI